MKIVLLIILAVIFVNTIAAIITVFRQPRNIAAIWGWLLVLIFIPVLGFLFHAFFGRRLPKSSLLRLEGSPKKDVTSTIKSRKNSLVILAIKKIPIMKLSTVPVRWWTCL